jgi:hypothetical protein
VTEQLPDLRALRRDKGLSLDEACDAINAKHGSEVVFKSVLARAEKREAEPRNGQARLAIAAFYGYTVTQVWPEPTEVAA